MPVSTTPYTGEMVLIHRVFRREADLLPRLVARTGTGDAARAGQVAEAIREHVAAVRRHHRVEDEVVWPLLHARAAVYDDLVIRMEDQHRRVGTVLDGVDGLLPPWEAGAAAEIRETLVAALTTHREVLLEHLTAEEQLIMPLVEEHLTRSEWEPVGRMGNIPPLGAVLADATPAERAFVMAKLPLPDRIRWRLSGRREYDRTMAARRGGY